MATLIRDPILEERILAERAARGADRFDEVWEGVYVMPPMPNDEHQMLVGRFQRILDEIIGDASLGHVRPGVNVSDRTEAWQQNYRVPDVAVFLNNSSAVNCDAFWYGGPDLAVEILSPGDQDRDKLPFYAQVKTKEVLIVDRNPWQLELYRWQAVTKSLQCVGTSTAASNQTVMCQTVPIGLQLQTGTHRPVILIELRDSQKTWSI
ncbi:MAG: Uma2 family endonuclease [Pirellulaceae bacterium]